MGKHTSLGLIPPDDPRLQRTSIIVGTTLTFAGIKARAESKAAQEAKSAAEEPKPKSAGKKLNKVETSGHDATAATAKAKTKSVKAKTTKRPKSSGKV